MKLTTTQVQVSIGNQRAGSSSLLFIMSDAFYFLACKIGAAVSWNKVWMMKMTRTRVRPEHC